MKNKIIKLLNKNKRENHKRKDNLSIHLIINLSKLKYSEYNYAFI